MWQQDVRGTLNTFSYTSKVNVGVRAEGKHRDVTCQVKACNYEMLDGAPEGLGRFRD